MTLSPEVKLALADTVRQRLVVAATANPEFDAKEAIRCESEALRVSEGEVESNTEAFLGQELLGLGELQAYLDDPSVEEIWVNGPHHIFVARAGVSEHLPISLSPQRIRDLVERMLLPSGRRVDMSKPFVDASLPDGSRVHVVIPDITRRHWSVNIRKFSQGLSTLADLVEVGSLSLHAAHYLRDAVIRGQSVLVSGATQAGKTTLLNALLDAVPRNERIITVEETFELKVPGPDHVGMQCRGPSLEGTGEVNLRRLVKEALRMRPDRIVVGEVREAEALDMLIAFNSGLPGMCSIHAKSAEQALVKLQTLPLLAGQNIDASFVGPTVAGTIDVVVHMERNPQGVRRAVSIIEPLGSLTNGVIDSVVRFDRRSGSLLPTGEIVQA
jgi:pilus assembly protein CpaF